MSLRKRAGTYTGLGLEFRKVDSAVKRALYEAQEGALMANPITQIPLTELITTWRTLRKTSLEYHMGSQGEASLIEARRLIEVEIRARYGDDAWLRVTHNNDSH
jgi:hypothetical protein